MQKSRYLYPLILVSALALGCRDSGESVSGPEQYLSAGKRVVLNSAEGQPLFKIRRKSRYDKVYDDDLRGVGRVWVEDATVHIKPLDGEPTSSGWSEENWSLGERVRIEPMEEAWLVWGAKNKLIGYLTHVGDVWEFRREWGEAPEWVASKEGSGAVVKTEDKVVARSTRMTPLEAICALLPDLGPLERVALSKALELV